MKNYLSNFTFVGIFAACSILSSGAFASDGTINISGALTSSSCTVTGSPSGQGGDVSIKLDTISVRELGVVGDIGGLQPFIITLSACTPSVVGSVKAGFEVGPTTDQATGRLNLINGPGAATHVQLQLRNTDNSVIKVGDQSTVNGATVSANGAILDYMVNYYASGVPTAGSVNSSVTYSIVYP